MRNLFQKTLVCVAIATLQLALPVKNLHAGPFLDWLLGRPVLTYPAQPATTAVPVLAPTSAAYPATVGYPVTAGYAATTAAGCPCQVTANYAAPATACASPCAAPVATAYMPAVVAAQPIQYSTPTVVGYAPAYRSSWYRVPVTYYRPVTAYTGVAAQPVTVMQPCNTQTYQVQRTPYLFHRPWLPATTTATYAPVVTQPAYATVTAPNCPCNNAAAVSPSLNTTPYYPPSTPLPSTGIPSTTMPSNIAPSAHIPGSSDTPPGTSSSVPADQPPALQQFDPSQSGFPNSASLSSPGATGSARLQRVTPNTASSVYQVKPIPDPQLNQPTSPARVIAPPLLNPRERTASQTSARLPNVAQAVYKTPVSAPAPRAEAPAKQQLWNDSGWHSAGR